MYRGHGLNSDIKRLGRFLWGRKKVKDTSIGESNTKNRERMCSVWVVV